MTGQRRREAGGVIIDVALVTRDIASFVNQDNDESLKRYLAIVKNNMGLETEMEFDPDKKGSLYRIEKEQSWLLYLTHSGMIVEGEEKDSGDMRLIRPSDEIVRDIRFTRLGDEFVLRILNKDNKEHTRIQGILDGQFNVDAKISPLYSMLEQMGVADYTLQFVVQPAVSVLLNNDLIDLIQID